MNGITPFNDFMKNLEKIELDRELMKIWYKERTNRITAPNVPKPLTQRNN